MCTEDFDWLLFVGQIASVFLSILKTLVLRNQAKGKLAEFAYML